MAIHELSGLDRHRGWLKQVAKKHIAQKLSGKLDASDVVQETLLRAHRARSSRRDQSKKSLHAWLLEILANYLAEAHRSHYCGKRDVGLERSIQEDLNRSSNNIGRWLESQGVSPLDHLAAQETRDRVLAALDELSLNSTPQYEAVIRIKIDGEKIEQVAITMGKTKRAVAGYLRRGLEKLRIALTDDT